jgi:uncharacterized protein YlbG (UPF0298 family)
MIPERAGIIVWLTDSKSAKSLERFGLMHYVSKRMHYAVLYVFADKVEETMRQLQRLHYVRKVERSYRNEIKTEYSNAIPDKTRFYSY